jgi:hypothetical protein
MPRMMQASGDQSPDTVLSRTGPTMISHVRLPWCDKLDRRRIRVPGKDNVDLRWYTEPPRLQVTVSQ